MWSQDLSEPACPLLQWDAVRLDSHAGFTETSSSSKKKQNTFYKWPKILMTRPVQAAWNVPVFRPAHGAEWAGDLDFPSCDTHPQEGAKGKLLCVAQPRTHRRSLAQWRTVTNTHHAPVVKVHVLFLEHSFPQTHKTDKKGKFTHFGGWHVFTWTMKQVFLAVIFLLPLKKFIPGQLQIPTSSTAFYLVNILLSHKERKQFCLHRLCTVFFTNVMFFFSFPHCVLSNITIKTWVLVETEKHLFKTSKIYFIVLICRELLF